ncbi:MAG TPA: GyrI-like domain-containing protein [Chryseosolibacter sp.]
MQPRIEVISEKKLVGLSTRLSLTQNRTAALWQSFQNRKKEITNAINTDRISLQLYDANYFRDFNPSKEFTKWAAVEVFDFSSVPSDMQTLIIPAGEYAVFHYKGSSTDNSIFQYIFSVWLPKSDYALDNRPHFEVLGDKYKNADPSSEEDIYVPVRKK